MRICTVIHEWTIETVASEDGPKRQLTWLEGCRSCGDFNNCLSIASFCHMSDDLEQARSNSRAPTNLNYFIRSAEYVPSF